KKKLLNYSKVFLFLADNYFVNRKNYNLGCLSHFFLEKYLGKYFSETTKEMETSTDK
ncbi:hypothetical protein SAMN04487928_1731, partial [Butyrivibrio proteoclasticus]